MELGLAVGLKEILHASWPEVLKIYLNGKTWYDPILVKAQANHKLNLNILGFDFDSWKVLRVPIIWSHKTELDNKTVNNKIDLIKNIMFNAIEAHDFALTSKLEEAPNGLYVDATIRYHLSPTYNLPKDEGYVTFITTLYGIK